MKDGYPRFQAIDESDLVVARDGVIVCFFMRRSHSEIGPLALSALELYQEFVGPERLKWIVSEEGEFQLFDAGVRSRVHQALRDTPPTSSCLIELEERDDAVSGFHFEYRGRWLKSEIFAAWPQAVSFVSCWFPTEWLEEVGTERVREFAVSLGSMLPFDSGYASLAFNYAAGSPEEAAFQAMRGPAMRHPGIDVHLHSYTAFNLGFKIPGAYWLTFIGPKVAEKLGGADGLRDQLGDPEIVVQALPGNRLMAALGHKPEVGDVNRRMLLPKYRKLAQVIEGFLHRRALAFPGFSEDDMERWELRFLTNEPTR